MALTGYSRLVGMTAMVRVEAVSTNTEHGFSKANTQVIQLVRGHGVEDDAHFGQTVQHLHLIKKDPSQINLRQVHLIALERINEWNMLGHPVRCGSFVDRRCQAVSPGFVWSPHPRACSLRGDPVRREPLLETGQPIGPVPWPAPR